MNEGSASHCAGRQGKGEDGIHLRKNLDVKMTGLHDLKRDRERWVEREKERKDGGREGTDRRKESITCNFPIVKNKPIKTNAT